MFFIKSDRQLEQMVASTMSAQISHLYTSISQETQRQLNEQLSHLYTSISQETQRQLNDQLSHLYTSMSQEMQRQFDYQYVNTSEELQRLLSESNKAMTKWSQAMMWMMPLTPQTPEEHQREFWSQYPKAQGILHSIQQCNLILMDKLQRLCNENGIQFWLHAGTLIGALRHQGFIPWDDDVDIGMTRQHFNRLREILETDSELHMREYYHDTKCSKGFQIQYRHDNLPCFLDVVPFDWCDCTTQEERYKFLEGFRDLRKEMLNEFNIELGAPPALDVGLSHFGPYPSETKAMVDELIERYAAQLEQLESGASLYYGFEAYPFPYPVIAQEDLFPLQKVRFEESYFWIPSNSEYYLYGYGNIWDIPQDIGSNKHLYAYQDNLDAIERFIAAHSK